VRRVGKITVELRLGATIHSRWNSRAQDGQAPAFDLHGTVLANLG
jgi:hypothetical protein